VGFVMFFLTEAWILSIMAVFLYKCLLQVSTRWLCSKSLQLSADQFFWGRDNCSLLQRKLSQAHHAQTISILDKTLCSKQRKNTLWNIWFGKIIM
jgi:hypothetical protein